MTAGCICACGAEREVGAAACRRCWLRLGKPTARDMVAEFHRVMEQPIADAPTVADRATRQLRYDLIEEELTELFLALGDVVDNQRSPGMNAAARPDLVAIADALGDLKVVIEGAALAFGIDLDAVVAEIHRSNMSKLGPDGRPIKRADGKVLKGPNYAPPDLARVLGVTKP